MEPLYCLGIVSIDVDQNYQEIRDLTLGEALDLIEEYADGTNEFGLTLQ